MRITLHNKSRYAKRAAVSRHLSAIQAGIVTGDTEAAPQPRPAHCIVRYAAN